MRTVVLMEKIAEVAPNAWRLIQETQDEVRQSPFRDEIVEQFDGILKVANTGGFANSLAGRGLIGGAGAIGLGIAASLAGDIYDSLKRGVTKSRNYKAMMAANPDLHDHPAPRIQSTFSTLHQFNPDFASDPHVAGSYVRQQITLAGEHGNVDLHTLTNLVGARKNLVDSRKLQLPGKAPWEMYAGPEMEGLGKSHIRSQIGKNEADIGRAEDSRNLAGPQSRELALKIRRMEVDAGQGPTARSRRHLRAE